MKLQPQSAPSFFQRSVVASLCTALNGDPIEKTSDLLRYLAGNPFYRDLMVAFHDTGNR
mgnify:CR=1 FL=1